MSELRSLPSVDALSRSERLAGYPERVRIAASRTAIDAVRRRNMGTGDVLDLAVSDAERRSVSSLRPVINASGVILHTGLGRARLADAAVDAVRRVAEAHSSLELDLDSGLRGDRQGHVRELLTELTGAEDALVVNNAAAGVILGLATTSFGKEVILSRGEMVEIGGSFRIPEIIETSGCRLVEVGCTNKTRLSDYDLAITQDSATILRCHRSNFRISGFTAEPTLSELVQLATDRRIQSMHDQGTGALVSLTEFGLPHEPTLKDSVSSGVGLAVASGDKLLGGPQAGIMLGRKIVIEAARAHPLARAFRIDKLTLAALEATLKLYATGRHLQIPTYRYISRPLPEIRTLAEMVEAEYSGRTSLEEGTSEIGGGCAPGVALRTVLVGLETVDPDGLARALRQGNPPILGRIERGKVWLDLRTVEQQELPWILQALRGTG